MEGLTAKVFRTYNASHTMAMELKKMKPTGNLQDRIKDYNEANRRVAILCNHKRTIPASHGTQMEKMTEKVSRFHVGAPKVCRQRLMYITDQRSQISEVAD